MLLAERFWLVAPVAWCELDGQWVVFQPANGLVCELDVLSGWVLSVLELQEASAESLIAMASDATAGSPVVADSLAVVDATWALFRAGLIEIRHPNPAACV